MEPDKKKQRKEDKEKKPDTFSSTPKNDAPASHNGLTRTPLPTEPVEQQVIGALNHGQPTPAAGAALALFAKTRAGATLPKASVTGGRAAPGSGAKKEHVASPDEVARNIRLGLTDRGKELGASNTQASQRPQFTSPSTSAYFVKNSFGTFDNPGVFGTPGILHAGQIHAAAGSYDKSTEAGVTTSPYSKTAYGSASDVPHQPGTAKFNPYDPFPPAASAPGGSTVMPAPDPYKVSERPSTFLVRSQPFGSTAAAGGGESQPRPILRHRPQPPRPSGSPGSASHPVNVERSTPRTPPNGIRGRPTKFGKRPREESTESPDTSPVRPHLPANTRTHTQTSTGGPSRPPLPGNIRSHIQASTNDPARVLAQPRNAAPAVDIGPPYTSVLIQYRCSSKKLGPDQLIGIAVISVPRQQVYLSGQRHIGTSIEAFQEKIDELTIGPGDDYGIASRLRAHGSGKLRRRKIIVRYQQGQPVGDTTYDSVIDSTNETTGVIVVMAHRGWKDEIIVWYEMVEVDDDEMVAAKDE